MKKRFGDEDPVILELRKQYPKNGPDPYPGENLDEWAERYMEYVRKKYNLSKEEK